MDNIRRSVGIACCRKKTERSPVEILLVQRRITYSFQDFIFGRYRVHDLSKIKFLIKGMTAVEQSNLLTGNFEMLFWLATYYKKDTYPDLYAKLSKKFNDFAVTYDLKALISQSASSLPIYEIPKGKPNNKEMDLNASVRELYEETNIDKSMYKIVFEPVSYSYQDGNYIYNIKYFPAWTQYLPHTGQLQPVKKHQTHEIAEARWMDMNMIRTLGNKRLEILVQRIFNVLQSKQTH